jgi:hypothetical protein
VLQQVGEPGRALAGGVEGGVVDRQLQAEGRGVPGKGGQQVGGLGEIEAAGNG